MLVPTRKAVELTGYSANTLRKYANEGKIKVQRLNGGNRMYDISDIERLCPNKKRQPSVVCYCRVSSAKQKNDLARQVAYMRQEFRDADIVSDIGSGLNFRRKGLQTILQRLLQGDKFTLIVAHRDRLCRFGFELIEYLFQQNGGEIMVLDKNEHSPEQELATDLLAILHVFSCRMHGLRRYESEIKKDKDISHCNAEESVQTMDGGVEEDIQ